MDRPDAIVVGSGPNGLAAALTLARAGHGVEVYEGAPTIGGGTRTEELTLAGFHHDVWRRCTRRWPPRPSSAHSTSPASAWCSGSRSCRSPIHWAAPAPPRSTATWVRRHRTWAGTPRRTADLVGPIVDWLDRIVDYVLGAMRSVPRDPLTLARFALVGTPSVRHATRGFSTDAARALLAGASAHSMQPLTAPLTSAFGLLLTALGHGVGWPVVQGGSAAITQGTGDRAAPPRWRRAHRELGHLAGGAAAGDGRCCSTRRRASSWRWRGLACHTGRGAPGRASDPGPGACKVDWALDGPVPWSAEACRRTVTVHVGGTFDEVARSRSGGPGRAAPRAALRPRRPALRGRPDAGSGRQAHAVGLLPRPERLDPRHERADGGADRALRPGLSRPDPRTGGADGRPRRRRTTRTCWAAT